MNLKIDVQFCIVLWHFESGAVRNGLKYTIVQFLFIKLEQFKDRQFFGKAFVASLNFDFDIRKHD